MITYTWFEIASYCSLTARVTYILETYYTYSTLYAYIYFIYCIRKSS